MRFQIKKFLETNYPRGKAAGVFRSFHFDLKDQKSKFIYYTSPKTVLTVLIKQLNFDTGELIFNIIDIGFDTGEFVFKREE